MPNYIRHKQNGGTWFFTINLLDRKSDLLTRQINRFRAAITKVKRKRPFRIDAMVTLPDHLHCVWTLPENDSDYSQRISLIKAHFSRSIEGAEVRSASREKRRERGIWQRRFWEHYIRDESDYQRHVAYCYLNPVKHGLVRKVRDWPHSTFHRDVRAGLLPPDWGGERDVNAAFGERNG